MLWKPHKTADRLDVFAALIFIGAAFSLIGIPALQALFWLKDGEWHPIPTSYALSEVGLNVPQTSWIGAQKILDAIFGLPLALVGFIAVSIVGTVVSQVAKDVRAASQKTDLQS